MSQTSAQRAVVIQARVRAISRILIQLVQFDLVAHDSNQLVFTATFWGRLGKNIRIENAPIKIRYANGKDVSVVANLTSLQQKAPSNLNSKEQKIQLGVNYTFAVDPGYTSSFLILKGVFPFEPTAIEVELPIITLEGEAPSTIIRKFKFTDHWVLVPLNGC